MKTYDIKKKRGDFGEAAVCDYIINQGYKTITCNYRKKIGEIDIIALSPPQDKHKNEIVFIEVKTRKFDSLTDGIDSVNLSKRKKIVKTARVFLQENPQYGDINARFDVAEVIITTDDSPQLLELKYYKDAFDPALL